MKRQSVVVWNDAHGSLDEVSESDVDGRHRPHVIHTYGYIVRSDEIGVSIAPEWLPAIDGADQSYRGVTFIPRGMIIEERPKRRHKKEKEPAQDPAGIVP